MASQFGPPDLQALLAQLMQEQQTTRQNLLQSQDSGYGKVGAALGLGLGNLLHGKYDPKKDPRAQRAIAENAAWSGVDLTDPKALRERSKQFEQSNPGLSIEFQRAAMQAEQLILDRRKQVADTNSAETEADVGARTADSRVSTVASQAATAGVNARVAGATEKDQIGLARTQLKAAGVNLEREESARDFDEFTFANRVAKVALDNKYTSTQIRETEQSLADIKPDTTLGKLIKEQDALTVKRRNVPKDSEEYKALSKRIDQYSEQIQTQIQGVTTTIDGTELTKTSITNLQTKVQSYQAMKDQLFQLRKLISAPGSATGIVADARRKAGGVLASIVGEFDSEAGEAISKAIISDDQIGIRSAALLAGTKFAEMIHQGGDRYTKTAQDRADEILATLSTTTDDRTSLEAVTRLSEMVESAYQADLARLMTNRVLAGEDLSYLNDPDLMGQ